MKWQIETGILGPPGLVAQLRQYDVKHPIVIRAHIVEAPVAGFMWAIQRNTIGGTDRIFKPVMGFAVPLEVAITNASNAALALFGKLTEKK